MMQGLRSGLGIPAETTFTTNTDCKGTEAYLQVPKIADLLLFDLGLHRGSVFVFVLAVDLEFEPALVGKVQETDEAEGRADLIHLVLWIRSVQPRDDGSERTAIVRVCWWLVIGVL